MSKAILTMICQQGPEFAIRLMTALAIVVIGGVAIWLLGALLKKAVLKRGKKKALLAKFICSVVTKTCWALLLVTALEKLGLEVGPIVAGIGVTGFVLGFAFQESLGNLAAGIMIALNEPFQVGDEVKVASFDGTVVEVNMMATVLKTADGKKVVIPNKSAWGTPIINLTVYGAGKPEVAK